VLVNGADGFVGRVVCAKLLEAGYAPVAGVRSDDGWRRLRVAVPGLDEVKVLGDVSTIPDAAGAWRDIDAVVHLAARVHVMRDLASDPLKEFRSTNVGGTRNVALTAAKQGVRRMIFISTAKVNGELTTGKPFGENDAADPQDAYAVSKWEAEEMLRRVAAETAMEVVIIRPPLVYGPGVRANFLRLLKLADHALFIPIPNTQNRRSLVGVDNLSDLIVQCVCRHEAANQTYMVSDGEDVSTRELVSRLAVALGHEVRFIPIPASLTRIAARLIHREKEASRLLDSLCIDSAKARGSLQWIPPVTLAEGLQATALWYRERCTSTGG
jgi:nucleoside-diphosphate-sugar epimerase